VDAGTINRVVGGEGAGGEGCRGDVGFAWRMGFLLSHQRLKKDYYHE
jgi:hypothetical protein